MKRVHIEENKNKNYITYSSCEYDRFQIESTLYLKCYNRITSNEWNKIITDLNEYKINEMVSHEDSVKNILIYKFKKSN